MIAQEGPAVAGPGWIAERMEEEMEQRVQNSSFEVIDLAKEAARAKSYDNHSIARVNDHEVRISTMTEAYHWHCHPDSDECFLALEGGTANRFR
jgi:hypothetical protein